MHVDITLTIEMSRQAAEESLKSVMRAIAAPPNGSPLALTIPLRDLHLRTDGDIRIPIVADAAYDPALSGFRVGIRARTNDTFFPRFNGRIGVVSAGPRRSELVLAGDYEPPVGGIGNIVDRSVLRSAAHRSLELFLRHIADEMSVDARERYGLRHL